MTEQKAIDYFRELLSVPDEMMVKYNRVLNDEQMLKLIELKQCEVMAIEALEKQTPKKVLPKLQTYDGCPVCKNKVYENQLYCDRCGQRLEH